MLIKYQSLKKESYGTKNSFRYFIGYNDNDVTRPLFIRLPKMTGYAKRFDENTAMSFRVNNKQLLRNYNKIWEKVKKLLNIDFKSKPVCDGDDDKYIKTKVKYVLTVQLQIFIIKKFLRKNHHLNVYQ